MLGGLILTLGQAGTTVPALGLVTGLFLHADGTPVNGSAQFKLSADFVSNAACFAPTVINFPVTSGSMTASVVFNDRLLPSGSMYQITVKEVGRGQVWNGKYSLVSGTANLTLIVPG